MKSKEEKEAKEELRKPFIVSRPLFYTIYGYIFLFVFIVSVLGGLFELIKDIANPTISIGSSVEDVIIFVVMNSLEFTIFKKIYEYINKTMYAITDKEVYCEIYYPFVRIQKNIPLNKITKISTLNLFWIFRQVVIYQYGKMPIVIWTWNNKEFKDELVKQISNETKKVENYYSTKDIMRNPIFRAFIILIIVVIAIAFIIKVVQKVNIKVKSKGIPGTYFNEGNDIELNKNGTCNISAKNTTKCEWYSYYSSDKDEIFIKTTYAYDKDNNKISGYEEFIYNSKEDKIKSTYDSKEYKLK